MADGVTINVKQMVQFAKNLGDTSTLKRIYNNAFANMLDELAALSKKSHEFTTRSGLLENSVETEIQNKLGFVFVDADRVPYAAAVYDGYEPFEFEGKLMVFESGGGGGFEAGTVFTTKILHPGYKGDPFILNNWQKHAKKLIESFLNDFVTEYKLSLKVA